MTNAEKQAKQSKAIELAKQGKTQKEIAKIVGVSEVSLSYWLKPYKQKQVLKHENLKLFDEQLNKLLKEQSPDIEQINMLTKAMNEYRKNI